MPRVLYDKGQAGAIWFIGASHFLTQYTDLEEPAFGKTEWGVDTLERTIGGIPNIYEAELAKLRQGTIYQFAGVNYYLQTFTPSDDTPFRKLKVSYKGLSRGIPAPIAENDTTAQTIQAGDVVVRYYAPQTTWRYVANTRLTKYNTVLGGEVPKIVEINGEAVPGDFGTFTFIAAHSSRPIIGTPYHECIDVVQTLLKGT